MEDLQLLQISGGQNVVDELSSGAGETLSTLLRDLASLVDLILFQYRSHGEISTGIQKVCNISCLETPPLAENLLSYISTIVYHIPGEFFPRKDFLLN
jgi:hypothetical protein